VMSLVDLFIGPGEGRTRCLHPTIWRDGPSYGLRAAESTGRSETIAFSTR
jgi:hypothetical protein